MFQVSERHFPTREAQKPRLGLIGVGAFGAFCIPHLSPYFDLSLHDPDRDLTAIGQRHGARICDLVTAAGQDIVVLAVTLRDLRAVAKAIAPHIKPGALVVDVCSIKVKPLAVLAEELPIGTEIIGTHPLFGPKSGQDGLVGLKVAVCARQGGRTRAVSRFLKDKLGLDVFATTAEQHDEQMAYVQGLTHLISRAIVAMDLPPLRHATATFDNLMRMVDMVGGDSDDVFQTITRDNPFITSVKQRFIETFERVAETEPSSRASLADNTSGRYEEPVRSDC